MEKLSISSIKELLQDKQRLIFYLCLSIVFLYIPNSGKITQAGRTGALYAISLFIIFSTQSIATAIKRLKELSLAVKIAIVILSALCLLSIITSDLSVADTLVGALPEFLGAFTWLSFVAIAAYIAPRLTQLILTKATSQLLVAIIGLSLIVDKFYITHGFRVSGLLMQPTAYAMFCVFACLIFIIKLLQNKPRSPGIYYTGIILSLISIILSQSRIGYIALIIGLGLIGLRHAKHAKLLLGITLSVVLVFSALILSYRSYFERFGAPSLQRGSSYRLDLYKISFQDTFAHNFIVGNGPASLPTAINDRAKVTDDILATLNDNFIFSSTHNLYLDVAYYFGFIVGGSLFILSSWAIICGIRSKSTATYSITVVFLILCLNAMFNTPTLELTLLYSMVLAGLIYNLRHSLKSFKLLQ